MWKRRLIDSIKHDLTEKGLSGVETQELAAWRRLIRNIDTTQNGVDAMMLMMCAGMYACAFVPPC